MTSTSSLSSSAGVTPSASVLSSSSSSAGSSATKDAAGGSDDGATIQITGLASGLNTGEIVAELMQVQQRPVTALQTQQQALTARNTQLTTIQAALRKASDDAMALLDPTSFRRTEATTSSDPTRVSASTGTGAGVGAYQVTVSQLASSAQRTFTFTGPGSADTISIDGHDTVLPAGASIQDLANAINNDNAATVYAAATDAGTLVLSSRQTGDAGAGYVQLSDGQGLLVEQADRARPGRDAIYAIDGTDATSKTNSVTGAIPGLTLTLSAVTTTSGSCTVNVAAPAPDPARLETAIKQFVTDYNTAIATIQTQLAQSPSASDPTKGALYADSQLRGLLGAMRTLMYQPGAGLPSGLSTMLDIGVSTGATSGSAAPSASSLSGNLTLNGDALRSALQNDPTAVQKVVGTWANSLASLVNAHAGPGGTIDLRIAGDDAHRSQLTRRISSMQAALKDKEKQLTQQFAKLESALSGNQSRSSWLAGQIAALPGTRTT